MEYVVFSGKKSILPKRLPISQQNDAAMPCYERKGDKKMLQRKSSTSRPPHIYALGFLNLR